MQSHFIPFILVLCIVAIVMDCGTWGTRKVTSENITLAFRETQAFTSKSSVPSHVFVSDALERSRSKMMNMKGSLVQVGQEASSPINYLSFN